MDILMNIMIGIILLGAVYLLVSRFEKWRCKKTNKEFDGNIRIGNRTFRGKPLYLATALYISATAMGAIFMIPELLGLWTLNTDNLMTVLAYVMLVAAFAICKWKMPHTMSPKRYWWHISGMACATTAVYFLAMLAVVIGIVVVMIIIMAVVGLFLLFVGLSMLGGGSSSGGGKYLTCTHCGYSGPGVAGSYCSNCS